MAEENAGNNQAGEQENPQEEGALAQPEETPSVQETIQEVAQPAGQSGLPTWPEPVAEMESKDDVKKKRNGGSGGAWLGGLVLIALGAIFLVQNTTNWRLNNWWALFLLIPAFGSFANAWRTYRAREMMNSAVSGSLTGGVIMLLFALVFLLDLNWGAIWPLFLIVIGVGSLLGGMRRG